MVVGSWRLVCMFGIVAWGGVGGVGCRLEIQDLSVAY